MNRLPRRRASALALPLVAGAAWVAPVPAAAQDDGLQRCLQIADIVRRVECYDAIARAQQAAPPAQPAQPASPAAPAQAPAQAPALARPAAPAAPAANPRAEFGLSPAQREQARPVEQRQLDEVEYQVAAVQPAGPGYFQFTTSDGTVWRSTEPSRSYRPPRKGDWVTIRSGSLGAFYLSADRQPVMRVVRVR